jgi:outer membrane lipoprotein-sorting protein
MKPRTTLLSLIAMTTAAVASDLSPKEANAVEKRFFATQQKTRTLEAAFTQTISAPGLRSPVLSRGQLFYRAPDDLRIAYTEPVGDLLQLDKARFTTIRAGQSPVLRPPDHPSARALSALRDILRGQRPPGDMHATVNRRGTDYIVVLRPATTGAFQPEQIENTIEAKTLQLRSMSITLPRGTVMKFDFSPRRRNQPLPSDAFTPL